MDVAVTQAPASLLRLGHRLTGTIHVTKHHMIFRAEQREIWICYSVISEMVRRPQSETGKAVIRLFCKDFMFVSLEFESDTMSKAIFDAVDSLSMVSKVEDLYAYVYAPASQEREVDGWAVYNPIEEYNRMGLDLTEECEWRLSKTNEAYGLCATYPALLVVPKNINDTVLHHAAKYRSKHRLPVLSYYHKLNRCSITRCAQPLIGIKQNRNMQDEKLIQAIFDTTMLPEGVKGAQTDNLVVDLRPSTNAFAQTALGGGTEVMDRYKNARKVYMSIDNLHVMRDSMNKVIDALRHSDVSAAPPNYASMERSQWLYHIGLILEGTKQVVQHVHFKCSHVVIHCSDGWDRTPQISSLAMLLLDPFYRTLEGFMVLVEKEWVSFGHQFAVRGVFTSRRPFTEVSEDSTKNMLANVTSFIQESTKGRQSGPIFQQFLDCVYQLLFAMPSIFQFNERFLRRLLYHSYSCQYGTFIFNSERERIHHHAQQKTRSVWDYFLARKAQFINKDYVQTDQVFLPPTSARWWPGAFSRPDEDLNDPEAWRRFELLSSNPAEYSPSLLSKSDAKVSGSRAASEEHEAAAPTTRSLKLGPERTPDSSRCFPSTPLTSVEPVTTP